MNDDLEDRLRAAAPSLPAMLDVDALHERAARRVRSRRRRRISLVASAVVVVVVALVTSLLALRENDPEPAAHVDTAVPHVTWTRMPGIAGRVAGIATGDGMTVAVGSDGVEAAIWVSTVGVPWTEAYVRPATTEVTPTPPCRVRCEAVVQSDFVAVAHGGGRFVAVGTRNGAATGQRGFIMTSTDGSTWTDADDEVFEPLRKPKSNLSTLPRDVAYFDGAFVVVGDLYTANEKQQAGLSPALWRSHDGLHWTRTVLHLGKGFDPYMDGLAVRGGQVVAAGGYEHGFGAWTTRDLRDWSFVPINRHGALHIVAVRSGFVASGGVCVSTKDCRKRVVDHMRFRPTLWSSRDGAHWSVALRLRSGVTDFNRVSTSFGPVGVAGKGLVAFGSLGRLQPEPTSIPLVYVSTDGRQWTDDRDAAVFPDGAAFTAVGSRGDELLVAGTVDDQPVIWIGSP